MPRSESRDHARRWAEIAHERGADAAVLHKQSRQLATLYFMGFVVEAYAKALASARGRSARKTHDLVPLLEDCEIMRSDLPVDLRVYAEERSVELRYEVALPAGTDYGVELARARRLAQFLRVRLNRLL